MMQSKPAALDRAVQIIQNRPLAAFAALTFVFSWLLWLAPRALGLSDTIIFRHLVALGAFAPALAGGLVGYLRCEPRPAIRWDWFMGALLAVGVLYILCLPYASSQAQSASNLTWAVRILLWAAPALVIALGMSDGGQLRGLIAAPAGAKLLTPWYAAALLAVPALFGLGYAAGWALGDAPQISLNGSAGEIALTIAASFIYMSLFGGALAEEPGLRGLALPALQQKSPPLAAAALLALAWTVWIVPLHLNGYYQASPDGALQAILFRGLLNLLLSVLLAWLYNRSAGNLLACILLHGSFTTASAFLPLTTPLLALLTAAVLALIIQAQMWQSPDQAA